MNKFTKDGRKQAEISMNRVRGRLLIFIVAYNAENTIENVLERIPTQLLDVYEIEILIIDDSSQDKTFNRSELFRRAGLFPFNLKILFNPVNQGVWRESENRLSLCH